MVNRKKVIPPRVLRTDPPPGIAWVPRWKWAGKLFGRQVRLPPEVRVAPVLADGKVPADRAPANATAPSSAPADTPALPAKDKIGDWARPLLTILALLVMVYGLGVGLGAVWTTHTTPSWMRQGIVGALLLAPAGAVLLLLAGFACLVQSVDGRGNHLIWLLWLAAGIALIGFFLWATFGALL